MIHLETWLSGSGKTYPEGTDIAQLLPNHYVAADLRVCFTLTNQDFADMAERLGLVAFSAKHWGMAFMRLRALEVTEGLEGSALPAPRAIPDKRLATLYVMCAEDYDVRDTPEFQPARHQRMYASAFADVIAQRLLNLFRARAFSWAHENLDNLTRKFEADAADLSYEIAQGRADVH